MKSFKLSLRTEIIINMTILMLTMIILVSILTMLISKKDIYLKKAEGSLAMIQALSNIAEPIINTHSADPKIELDKKIELEKIVGRFFKNLDTAEIIIANSSGLILYNSNKQSTDDTVSDKTFFEIIRLQTPITQFKEEESILLKEGPNYLFIYVPIIKDGTVNGGIIAQFSLGEEMFHAAKSQSLIFIFILLDALLFILFGSFLLSRIIVNPINKLVNATEKVAAGNLDYKVEPLPAKELDRLAESFNKMTKKLLKNKENLQEHVESLEKLNLELKTAKDEVLRSEKLASVGRLATGIAHEIGNPLGSIFGYLEILSEDKNVNLDDYLKRINKECIRIDSIVKELLDYSRKHKFKMENVNLNDLITDTLSTTLHRKMFDNIKCHTALQDDLPNVKVDKMQMQQVITNMLINAADAMPSEHGEIKISTSSVSYSKELFTSTELKEGDKLVCLSIHDTGTGIDKDDLNKIFDPFYTTKEPGKGTGLGLAISLRIIESFNGSINVQSAKGKGTTFNIYLPIRG